MCAQCVQYALNQSLRERVNLKQNRQENIIFGADNYIWETGKEIRYICVVYVFI